MEKSINILYLWQSSISKYMKTLAIVIPVYKDSLSVNEKIALDQAVRKFDKYDIFFLAPEGLHIEDLKYKKIKYQYLDIKWFCSVESYSNLMLTSDVYKRFIQYSYILIYQLDAFVFGDNINDFIEMNYDYIGAPTLEGMYKPYRAEKVLYTQNGGFSLRKVKAFINWTLYNKKEIELMQKFDAEDSIIYALRSKGLRIAPIDIALQFSFDSNVRECFLQNKMKLPLGCHAWERYDYEFWEPYIKEQRFNPERPEASKRIIKDYYAIKKYNDAWVENYSSQTVIRVMSNLLPHFDKSVYVWGMGKHGYEAMQLLLGAGIEIIAFLDNNPGKIKEGMFPCSAVNVKKVVYENKTIPIVVAMYHHVDACVYLERHGLHHHSDYITYMELYESFEIETMKG